MDWQKRDSINEWIFFKAEILLANVKVELDLSNCATKADWKNATGVDTSELMEY